MACRFLYQGVAYLLGDFQQSRLILATVGLRRSTDANERDLAVFQSLGNLAGNGNFPTSDDLCYKLLNSLLDDG